MKRKTPLVSLALLLASLSLAPAQQNQNPEEAKARKTNPPNPETRATTAEPEKPSLAGPLLELPGETQATGGANTSTKTKQPDSSALTPRSAAPRSSNATNPMIAPRNARVGRTRSALPSSALSDSAPAEVNDELATGILEEESNLDLNSAMTSYRSIIRRFDSQRQGAGMAIFRLAECYRKLGQIEEARTCYARILREFPDQAELLGQSQRYLFESPAERSASASRPAFQQRLHSVVSRAPSTGDAPADFGGAGLGGGLGGGGLGGGLGGSLGSFPGGTSGAGGMTRTSFGLSGAPGAGGFPGQSSGYGSFGRSQSPPARTDLERELTQAKGHAAGLKRQLSELHNLIDILRNAKPETLPEGISSDPRYRQLKVQYEQALLNESEDNPESQKNFKASLKKLKTWVERIYLPEQQAALDLAMRNFEQAQQEAAELEAKVKDEAQKRAADLQEQTLKTFQNAERQRHELLKANADELRAKQAVEGQPKPQQPLSPPAAAPTPKF